MVAGETNRALRWTGRSAGLVTVTETRSRASRGNGRLAGLCTHAWGQLPTRKAASVLPRVICVITHAMRNVLFCTSLSFSSSSSLTTHTHRNQWQRYMAPVGLSLQSRMT